MSLRLVSPAPADRENWGKLLKRWLLWEEDELSR